MDSVTPESNDPASLLAWYVAMGVDDAILSEPQDRFALSAERLAAVKKPIDRGPQKSALNKAFPKPLAAVEAQPLATPDQAREIAQKCKSLAELRKALENFTGCPLKSTAINTVFSDGVEGAPLMVVGDAPGAAEDKQGKPFLGAEGALLDKMLAAISFSRQTNAYLTTLVPWRPLGNRRPDKQTAALCLPFLERHIELAAPKALLILGGTTGSTLFNSDQNITKLRGKWESVNAGSLEIAAIATYQPAYLLQQPRFKADAWRDLLSLQAKLSNE